MNSDPIKSSSKFKVHYKSFNKLADELIRKWPAIFLHSKSGDRDAAKPFAKRSLGTMIGQLNNGAPSAWWMHNKEAIDCLVELLEIDREDLAFNPKKGQHEYALSAFPNCPPLDLREDYWCIAEPELLTQAVTAFTDQFHSKQSLDSWLTPRGAVFSNKKLEWLHVNDSIEFELLIGRLKAIGHHHLTHRDLLKQVLEEDKQLISNPSPLIVAIQSSSEIDDMDGLITCRKGAPLLVISQFPPPVRDTAKSSEDDRQAHDVEPAPIQQHDLNVWAWTFFPEWRNILTLWLDRRLKELKDDSLYSSEGIQEALKQLDPSGKWFESVEDMLVLCQAISEVGEKTLKKTGKKNDPQALLSLLLNRDETSLDLTLSLVERHWQRWDFPWEGGLTEIALAEIATGLCTIETLRKMGIAVSGSNGDVFQRPIIKRLILRSLLIKTLQSDNLEAWTPACFDKQRRPFLDAALDAIELDELSALAIQVSNSPVSASTLGACEAVFTAIARRIIRGESVGYELPSMAEDLIKHMKWKEGILFPYSRPLVSQAQQLEWVCACWAWSLLAPPSNAALRNWMFPGWNQEETHAIPAWVSDLSSNFSEQDWLHIAMPAEKLLSVTARWLAKQEKHPVWEAPIPALFCAALLKCAAEGKWKASPSWWSNVLNTPILAKSLNNLVKSADVTVNLRTVQAWWPSMVTHLRNRATSVSRYPTRWGDSKAISNSMLWNWVLMQIEEHCIDALEGLEEVDKEFLIDHRSSLPKGIKRQLLRSQIEDFPHYPTEMQFKYLNFFEHYGSEAAAEIAKFLDNEHVGDEAAINLWKWTPKKAELLLNANKTSHKTLHRLIRFCPTSSISAALDRLEEIPSLLTAQEKQNWALRHLPDSRQNMQRLMALYLGSSPDLADTPQSRPAST